MNKKRRRPNSEIRLRYIITQGRVRAANLVCIRCVYSWSVQCGTSCDRMWHANKAAVKIHSHALQLHLESVTIRHVLSINAVLVVRTGGAWMYVEQTIVRYICRIAQ